MDEAHPIPVYAGGEIFDNASNINRLSRLTRSPSVQIRLHSQKKCPETNRFRAFQFVEKVRRTGFSTIRVLISRWGNYKTYRPMFVD
jgi:hypothetical protein